MKTLKSCSSSECLNHMSRPFLSLLRGRRLEPEALRGGASYRDSSAAVFTHTETEPTVGCDPLLRKTFGPSMCAARRCSNKRRACMHVRSSGCDSFTGSAVGCGCGMGCTTPLPHGRRPLEVDEEAPAEANLRSENFRKSEELIWSCDCQIPKCYDCYEWTLQCAGYAQPVKTSLPQDTVLNAFSILSQTRLTMARALTAITKSNQEAVFAAFRTHSSSLQGHDEQRGASRNNLDPGLCCSTAGSLFH